MKHKKLMIAFVAIISQMMWPAAMADVADSSQAQVNISGNVPVIFSLTARGIPGDLDLTPGVSVTDRTIGIFHFKYNLDIASLLLTSNSATGTPKNGATAYPAGAAFTYKFAAGCASVNAAGLATFSIAAGTSPSLKNLPAAQPSTLGYGIEEDCQLTASWGGQAVVAGQLPLSGVYSETLTLTMVSP